MTSLTSTNLGDLVGSDPAFRYNNDDMLMANVHGLPVTGERSNYRTLRDYKNRIFYKVQNDYQNLIVGRRYVA